MGDLVAKLVDSGRDRSVTGFCLGNQALKLGSVGREIGLRQVLTFECALKDFDARQTGFGVEALFLGQRGGGGEEAENRCDEADEYGGRNSTRKAVRQELESCRQCCSPGGCTEYSCACRQPPNSLIFRELAKYGGGIGSAGLGALCAPRLEPCCLNSWVRISAPENWSR